MNKSPFVNMLIIYDSATQTGKQLQQYVPLITKNRQKYYKVNYLDCNTQDKQVIQRFHFCNSELRPKLPALQFFQPTLNGQGQSTQHQYQGQLDQKKLFQFAEPLMKAFSAKLKKVKDWNMFQQKNSGVPNILYFTDKQKLPTIYKTLTANFRKTIAFGHVNKDSPLCDHLKITKFPTLLLNGRQQIQLSKNLDEMIEKLKKIQGQQTQIQINTYQSNIQQISHSNIQKLVYQTPEHILIHVSSQDGNVHPEWKKCQQSFKKMFTYYETNTLSKQLGVKQTPAIVYFPKSLAKKAVQKTVFSPKDSFRTIYDEISSIIQDFTVPLANDMQMQKLTSIPLQQGKYIAVLFHQQQISLSYRVLSNDDNYKKDIIFFRMKNPQNSILQKFQITKLPALFIMINDKSQQSKQSKKKQQQLPQGRVHMNLQLAKYTGKFNYDDLSRYLNVFIKKPNQNNQETQNEKNQKQGHIVQITNSKLFNKNCKDLSCYILLTDARQKNIQVNQNYKNQVKKLAGRVNNPIVLIDGACHSQILATLEIQLQQLPVFLYLNSKFEKSARMIGRIQQKSLNTFIGKIKSNKAIYRGYNNISFDNKKQCIQQHQKLNKYQTNGSQLNEYQQQILKQIQEQQKKKKQQKQTFEKQDEKNKKKRKRRPKNQINSQDL